MSHLKSLNAGDYATFGDLLQYEKHYKLLLSHQNIRKIWHKEIASITLGDILRGSSHRSQVCELLPKYKLPNKTEILLPNQDGDPHTKNMLL